MYEQSLRFVVWDDGVMFPYAGTSAPSGWLMCYGQAVSRTTYAVLFSVIGTTYGAGDGSTTFNLPDARGRVVAGRDNMGGTASNRLTIAQSGVDGATLGAAGGSQMHQLTVNQIPSHAHSAGNSNGFWIDMPGRYIVNAGGNIANLATVTETSPTGGGQQHNNTQPTIIVNQIIKI